MACSDGPLLLTPQHIRSALTPGHWLAVVASLKQRVAPDLPAALADPSGPHARRLTVRPCSAPQLQGPAQRTYQCKCRSLYRFRGRAAARSGRQRLNARHLQAMQKEMCALGLAISVSNKSMAAGIMERRMAAARTPQMRDIIRQQLVLAILQLLDCFAVCRSCSECTHCSHASSCHAACVRSALEQATSR